MKKIKLILLLLTAGIFASAQTLSPKVLASAGGYFTGGGKSLSWTMGETFTTTLSSANNKLTQGFQQPEVIITNVNCTAFLEGYYRGSNTMVATLNDLGISGDNTATDTIEVNLWNVLHLSNSEPDFSQKTILHTNGTATIKYQGINPGSFYIALKHRNSLETWSSIPVDIGNGPLSVSYNFTDNITKAYGDGVNPPMKALTTVGVPDGKFGMYGGDIDRNGGIDILDMTVADNDATLFFFGYNDDCSGGYPVGSSACADGLGSDVDGDGATGIYDMSIIDNNSVLFLFYARPI